MFRCMITVFLQALIILQIKHDMILLSSSISLIFRQKIKLRVSQY